MAIADELIAQARQQAAQTPEYEAVIQPAGQTTATMPAQDEDSFAYIRSKFRAPTTRMPTQFDGESAESLIAAAKEYTATQHAYQGRGDILDKMYPDVPAESRQAMHQAVVRSNAWNDPFRDPLQPTAKLPLVDTRPSPEELMPKVKSNEDLAVESMNIDDPYRQQTLADAAERQQASAVTQQNAISEKLAADAAAADAEFTQKYLQQARKNDPNFNPDMKINVPLPILPGISAFGPSIEVNLGKSDLVNDVATPIAKGVAPFVGAVAPETSGAMSRGMDMAYPPAQGFGHRLIQNVSGMIPAAAVATVAPGTLPLYMGTERFLGANAEGKPLPESLAHGAVGAVEGLAMEAVPGAIANQANKLIGGTKGGQLLSRAIAEPTGFGAIAGGGQAARNVIEGRPVGENVPEAVVSGAEGALPFMLPHVAKILATKRGKSPVGPDYRVVYGDKGEVQYHPVERPGTTADPAGEVIAAARQQAAAEVKPAATVERPAPAVEQTARVEAPQQTARQEAQPAVESPRREQPAPQNAPQPATEQPQQRARQAEPQARPRPTASPEPQAQPKGWVRPEAAPVDHVSTRVASAREVLGIGPDEPLTPERVQQAYRDTVRKVHPDMAGGSLEENSLVNGSKDILEAQMEGGERWKNTVARINRDAKLEALQRKAEQRRSPSSPVESAPVETPSQPDATKLIEAARAEAAPKPAEPPPAAAPVAPSGETAPPPAVTPPKAEVAPESTRGANPDNRKWMDTGERFETKDDASIFAESEVNEPYAIRQNDKGEWEIWNKQDPEEVPSESLPKSWLEQQLEAEVLQAAKEHGVESKEYEASRSNLDRVRGKRETDKTRVDSPSPASEPVESDKSSVPPQDIIPNQKATSETSGSGDKFFENQSLAGDEANIPEVEKGRAELFKKKLSKMKDGEITNRLGAILTAMQDVSTEGAGNYDPVWRRNTALLYQEGRKRGLVDAELPAIEKYLQGEPNALQERRTTEVLPREQGQAGEAGSERRGVGQGQQGQEAARAGEAPAAPGEPAPKPEAVKEPTATEIPDVPGHVAREIARANAPDWGLRELVRVYGKERGEAEYAARHGGKMPEVNTDLINKAKETAKANGWDWSDVEAKVRKQLGLDENWLTPEQARQVRTENEAKAAQEADAKHRQAIQDKMLSDEKEAKLDAEIDAVRRLRERGGKSTDEGKLKRREGRTGKVEDLVDAMDRRDHLEKQKSWRQDTVELDSEIKSQDRKIKKLRKMLMENPAQPEAPKPVEQEVKQLPRLDDFKAKESGGEELARAKMEEDASQEKYKKLMRAVMDRERVLESDPDNVAAVVAAIKGKRGKAKDQAEYEAMRKIKENDAQLRKLQEIREKHYVESLDPARNKVSELENAAREREKTGSEEQEKQFADALRKLPLEKLQQYAKDLRSQADAYENQYGEWNGRDKKYFKDDEQATRHAQLVQEADIAERVFNDRTDVRLREGPEEILPQGYEPGRGMKGVPSLEVAEPKGPKPVTNPQKFGGESEKQIAKRGETPADMLATPATKDQVISYKRKNKDGESVANLKKFISEVPEFELDPKFTVTENGRLKFKDGGTYEFEPKWLGISIEGDAPKPGQTIGIDIESVNKLKAGDVLRVDTSTSTEQQKATIAADIAQREADKESAKRGFWIKTEDGWEKVKGTPVRIEGLEGQDLFIHKDGKFYVISEAKTGQSIARAKSEVWAIDSAKEWAQTDKGKSMGDIIDKYQKEGGELSPRYAATPAPAPKAEAAGEFNPFPVSNVNRRSTITAIEDGGFRVDAPLGSGKQDAIVKTLDEAVALREQWDKESLDTHSWAQYDKMMMEGLQGFASEGGKPKGKKSIPAPTASPRELWQMTWDEARASGSTLGKYTDAIRKAAEEGKPVSAENLDRIEAKVLQRLGGSGTTRAKLAASLAVKLAAGKPEVPPMEMHSGLAMPEIDKAVGAAVKYIKNLFGTSGLKELEKAGDDIHEAAVKHGSSREFVRPLTRDLLAKIFPDEYKNPDAMANTARILNMDNILGIHQFAVDSAADKLAQSQSARTEAKDKIRQYKDPATYAGLTGKQTADFKARIRDEINELKETATRLARESAQHQKDATEIEQAQNLGLMESEVQAAKNDPKISANINRWKQHYNPKADELYNRMKRLDPNTPREGRGKYFEARVNLLSEESAQQWREFFSDNQSPTPPEGKASAYRNPDVKRDRYDVKAKGTGTYSDDAEAMIGSMLGQRLPEATKVDLIDALVKSGNAVEITQPRQGVPQPTIPEGFERMPMKVPVTDPNTGSTTNPEHQFFVKKELVNDLKNVLATDVRPKQGPLMKSLTGLQMASGIDFVAHSLNIWRAVANSQGAGSALTDVVRKTPILGGADAAVRIIKKVRQVFRDTPEIRQQQKELAELGVLRPDYPHKGIQKITGSLLHKLDTAARMVLDDFYTELVKRNPAMADSFGGRREFINQVGQYNRRLMSKLQREFRDYGFSPFVVAGRAMNKMTRRIFLGDPGYDAGSTKGNIVARAIQYTPHVMLLAIPAMVNTMTTGKPGGRPGTPLGAIDLGTDDEKGRMNILDLAQYQGLRRGYRNIGAQAAFEGIRQGKSLGQIVEQGIKDVGQGLMHPWTGPAPAMLAKTFLGKQPDMRGYMEAHRIEGGGGAQYVENARAALESQNPLAYAIIKPFLKGAGIDQSEDGVGGMFAKGTYEPAFGALGMKSVPKGQNAAEELARDIVRGKLGEGLTWEEEKKMATKKPIMDMLKKDKKQGQILLEKQIEDGNMTEQEAANMVRRSGMSDLNWNIRMLTPDQAVKVWKAATPEQKDEIRDAMIKKFSSMDIPEVKQAEYFKQTGIESPNKLDLKRHAHELRKQIQREYTDRGYKTPEAFNHKLQLLDRMIESPAEKRVKKLQDLISKREKAMSQ